MTGRQLERGRRRRFAHRLRQAEFRVDTSDPPAEQRNVLCKIVVGKNVLYKIILGKIVHGKFVLGKIVKNNNELIQQVFHNSCIQNHMLHTVLPKIRHAREAKRAGPAC